MGVSHNVGDKLTYHVFCEDTKRVISRSVIRTADPSQQAIINKRLDPDISSNKESINLHQSLDSGEIKETLKETLQYPEDSGESLNLVNTSGESMKDSGEYTHSLQDSGESKKIENIEKPKGLSNKKINQRNKFPISKIRKSARQYGKMDRTSTRAMTQKEEMNINNTQQHHDMNKPSEISKSSTDMSHPKHKSHKE